MKRFLCAALAATILCVAPLAGAEDVPESYTAWVDLELDAEGRVLSAEPYGEMSDTMSQLIRGWAEQQQVEPIRVGGEARAGTTPASLTVSFAAEGEDGLAVFMGDLAPGPRIEDAVAPGYPARAAQKGQTGWVKLGFTVNEHGRPRDIEVLESSDPVFEPVARSALRQWRFKVAEVDGEGVPAEMTQTIEFNLDDANPQANAGPPAMGRLGECGVT